jgi:hypothetical protein
MGALEATDVQTASATSSVLAQASSSSIRVSWSPLENGTTGYVVYFGRTADAADILVSDLPAGSGRFDPTAPAVTYDPGRDLGLHPGDTACFRISGRDSAGGLASEFTLTCTTV